MPISGSKPNSAATKVLTASQACVTALAPIASPTRTCKRRMSIAPLSVSTWETSTLSAPPVRSTMAGIVALATSRIRGASALRAET